MTVTNIINPYITCGISQSDLFLLFNDTCDSYIICAISNSDIFMLLYAKPHVVYHM